METTTIRIREDVKRRLEEVQVVLSAKKRKRLTQSQTLEHLIALFKER